MAAEAEYGLIKRVWRQIYGVFGFTKGYNFILFFIFAGALMGFTLARLSFLDIDGQLCANDGMAPGECYYFGNDTFYRTGIAIHLASALPGSFLACFQFVPKIRHKVLMYHRIAGYIVILLMLLSNVSGMIISRRAFGGGPDIQSGAVAIGVLATIGLILAYYNIMRLQVDQHRAWMLRSFFYHAVIRAVMTDGPVGVGATFVVSFGVSTWVSFLVHAVGVELYLRLTPAGSERLRAVSYERQLKAGYKRP